MNATYILTESNDELYCKYQNQTSPQDVKLCLNLDTGEVSCYYDSNIGGHAQSNRAFNHLDIEWTISHYNIKGVQELYEVIEKSIQTILDNFVFEYDNGNRKGHLNDLAMDAYYEIEWLISKVAQDQDNIHEVWDAWDWFGNSNFDCVSEFKLHKDISDDKLMDITNEQEENALHDGYHVEGIYDYLKEIVAEIE